MVFADVSYQHFDWWHDLVPGAIATNGVPEDFEHVGLFNNKSVNVGFSLGINDYWNVTISQLFSKRCMEWEGPVDEFGNSLTVHHRTECSSEGFFDGDKTIAYGGYSGDARINFRYLLSNQGKGPGNRLFFGFGLDIPSDNVITESPWKKTNGEYTPHRHFYLSDGAYKANFEIQFYKKRMSFPVFWGGTFSIKFPLNESKFGFTPSNNYQLNLIGMSGSKSFQSIKFGDYSLSSIGFSLILIHNSRSSWEDLGNTPNSKSSMYIPGISILIGSKNGGGFGLTLSRGYQYYSQDQQSDIKETNDTYSISLNYRKVLDPVIEKLYW